MNSVERIDELESRLAFQEMTLAQLNDVIVEQRRELDELRRRFERALGDLNSVRELMVVDSSNEPPPPHY
jgi:SlyX protein